MRNLTIPHFQTDDAINADEVQGLRFGLMFLGRPVPGQDDHLATDLAFKEGAFFLNGQKIR